MQRKREGAIWLGAIRLGSIRLGAIRLGAIRLLEQGLSQAEIARGP